MRNSWLFLLCEGIISSIINLIFDIQDAQANEFSIIWIVIHVIFCFFNILGSKNIDKKERLILIGAFIFRLVLMSWDIVGRDIWAFPDMPDTYTFQWAASSLYHNVLGRRGGIYPKLIAYIVYPLFGEAPFIAQYINVVISISMIELVYKTLKLLRINEKYRFCSIVIISFLPYLAIDNSLLLREAIVQYFIAASCYQFICWIEPNGIINNIIYSIIFSLIATIVHNGAISITIVLIIGVVIYNRSSSKFELTNGKLVFTLVILIVFVVFNRYLNKIAPDSLETVDNIEDVVRIANSHTDGRSSYKIGTETNSISGLVLYTPIRMVYFIASPVPWLWRGLIDILSFLLSALPYIYILFISTKVVINKHERSYLFFFLLVAISSMTIFAWGVSNSGAAMRHRDKFIAPYILLFALTKNYNLQISK